MICGDTKAKMKKQKDCRARKLRERMRKWLGHHQEISDWEDARSMEKSERRLEPEGEAKAPQIVIVSDAVEKHFRGLGWRKPP